MPEAKSEKEKMLAGELYRGFDPELKAERERAERLSRAYSYGSLNAAEARNVLKELLGALGIDSTIRAPFYCDYGSNIYLGDGVFINFNAVFLDVMPVNIGDGTQIGPNVQFYAADHPRDPEVRKRGLENGKPIAIGKNVWIGGGAILLPGVTIGDDAIVGAGSVVTRSVARGVTVAGNPARVIRPVE
ncbi:MAG TPA: sugar O-acetyltransferase [Bryobacteraceae bacterium]